MRRLWITENSDYFITINAELRGQNHFCRDKIGPAVLEFARYYNDQQRWFCSIIPLMPDHIHMIICFQMDADLSRAVGYWKRSLNRTEGIS